MSFQLLSTIKGNLLAKILQSSYLGDIFHVKHKKLSSENIIEWKAFVVIPLESQIERRIFALDFGEFLCCFGEERDSRLPWFAGMIGKLKTGLNTSLRLSVMVLACIVSSALLKFTSVSLFTPRDINKPNLARSAAPTTPYFSAKHHTVKRG